MFSKQKGKTVRMFTTANESYPVYKRSDVLLMQSVCMKVPEPSTINWILYTSTCDNPKPSDIKQRSYVVSGRTKPTTSVGYYFYFVHGSLISKVVTSSTVRVKYAETTNVEQATSLNPTCTNDGKDLIPGQPFEDLVHGYYYICILATDQPVTFKLYVTEYYYDIHERHLCDNTELDEDGATHKCCHFSDKQAFSLQECAFLSANSSSPVPLTHPIGIEVSVRYEDVMKTVMIVAGVVILLLMVALMIGCFIRIRIGHH